LTQYSKDEQQHNHWKHVSAVTDKPHYTLPNEHNVVNKGGPQHDQPVMVELGR